MTPQDKQEQFYKELKSLLKKYKAELLIEDFGHNYTIDDKIVVDFKYDESFLEEYSTGMVPQLVLGTFENGD